MQKTNIEAVNNIFFIGIAGAGMSAIAQYLAESGKNISGSDRDFANGKNIETKIKLEKLKISCFPQDCSGINKNIDLVVVSTAIEKTVPEYQKSIKLGIPIIERSDLLALISETKFTIAIAGTSGKSTVTAMVYSIFEYAGLKPSLITGAGLIKLQKQGKIGNAVAASGKYLIIEVDESDGSIVKYKPEIGVILNVDKDHKDLQELHGLFETFRKNTKQTVLVNDNDIRSTNFSNDKNNKFGYLSDSKISGSDFKTSGFNISFKINEIDFELKSPGFHTMMNAIAATAVGKSIGISLETCSEALKLYEGIYRRHQIIGIKNDITLIDDYAHNPAKIAASIEACQLETGKLIVWFQPHGYGPTKFLRTEFVQEIKKALRENDQIWMSEIYYAGGTAVKDISSLDLINDISNVNAKFIEDKYDCAGIFVQEAKPGDVILLCGARDPGLSEFADFVFANIPD